MSLLLETPNGAFGLTNTKRNAKKHKIRTPDNPLPNKIGYLPTGKGMRSSSSVMTNPDEKFILCVDDDPDDRLMISEAIKDADPSMAVFEARNGIEARDFLQDAKLTGNLPCLVILDINMPLMDGKEMLKEIKKDGVLKTLPIVFFSTSSNPKDRFFSVEYGVDFVTKPSNFSSMVAAVKAMLSRCYNNTERAI